MKKHALLAPVHFGLACGITFGFGMLFVLLAMSAGWYKADVVPLISEFYKGTAPTFGGAIIGALWGFADAFLGGWLVALIYNKLVMKK
jgi:hypothetical protein